MTTTDTRQRRVRHELRLRMAPVSRVERLAPQMVRVEFSGDDLRDFVSAGASDHVKVFFPEIGVSSLPAPELTATGVVWPAGTAQPAGRDYTPRRFDPETATLTIDFVVHGSGPASTWADQAAPGQALAVGGPRGSLVIDYAFDWYLLIGDDTALPMIGRRLEEMPAGARAIVIVEVDGPADEIPFTSAASVDLHWVHRSQQATGEVSAIEQAVRAISIPEGEGLVWAAGEATDLRGVRRYLLREAMLPPELVHVDGHWKRGTVGFDHHQPIED